VFSLVQCLTLFVHSLKVVVLSYRGVSGDLESVREIFHFVYLVHYGDIGLVTQYCSELLRERLNLLRRTLVILAASTGRTSLTLDFSVVDFVLGLQFRHHSHDLSHSPSVVFTVRFVRETTYRKVADGESLNGAPLLWILQPWSCNFRADDRNNQSHVYRCWLA
jgi:hypothetical protein